jgi:hypothetical protein
MKEKSGGNRRTTSEYGGLYEYGTTVLVSGFFLLLAQGEEKRIIYDVVLGCLTINEYTRAQFSYCKIVYLIYKYTTSL